MGYFERFRSRIVVNSAGRNMLTTRCDSQPFWVEVADGLHGEVRPTVLDET